MGIKIDVKNLTKIFGKNPTSIIPMIKNGLSKEDILKKTGNTVGVYDVSFQIKEGEIFVIMGLSGSGKSTLIRCLNLLNKPTDGQILIDGEDIVKYNKKQLKEFRQKKVAMVFQHFGLFTHRTVLDNVVYGLEIRGMSEEERYEIAKETLAIVGLKGWEYKYPNELSGGMQQRVGLARALANNPDILLMDEPFSALDPLIKREMQQELLEIQAKLHKTIVFITHDINEAFKIGDRVAIMKDGIIEQIGEAEEILANPVNDYVKNFVKDIDRSKVLQAKNVMNRTTTLVSLKGGLKLAIKEMEQEGISSIFVVDQARVLQGYITIDDAIQAIKENKKLKDILKTDYHITSPETYLQELIPIATESKYPLVVVDNDNKFLGLIHRVSILSNLV